MYPQAAAILWAQWRSVANFYVGSHRRRFPLGAVVGVAWYGLWTFGAVLVASFLAAAPNMTRLTELLASGLLVALIYWQIMPIMMVSTGLSLDLTRLLVYPIPHGQLFTIEVLLRVSTAMEMLLMVAGASFGLWMNPQVPWWGPAWLAMFVALNLFLSAGIRDLLDRLLARKRFREAMIVLVVLVAALPQLMLVPGAEEAVEDYVRTPNWKYSPWQATAHSVLGSITWSASLALLTWVAIAYLFARWQFERSLRFDAAAAKSSTRGGGPMTAAAALVLRIPAALFKDPVAAVIEKELRVLGRSARFRLLFLMGFSFGLLIWLPLAMRSDDPDSIVRSSYLTIVSLYALMLLGEACFWNNLGFDRSAAQNYFVLPVKISQVLIGKNVAACFFVFIEVTMVAAVCAALRMPFSLGMLAEAYASTAVMTVMLLAVGNLISVRNPSPVNPSESWRNSSVRRIQLSQLVLYPVASAPVLLAFGARYGFDSELAFYGVLLLDFALALIVYWISMESSVQTAEEHKEQIIMTLSRSEGPVGH